ncbi:MAG: hypothetical protein KJ072_17010 [Verrucomicrobia bacterium]|nr:hypothetical protein [Verrucomicrobiota bacterium]
MNTRIQCCLYLATTLLVYPTRLPGDEPHQTAPTPPPGCQATPETIDLDLPGDTYPLVPGEPGRTGRRVGLAGLGLMAGVLGVIWSRRQRVQRLRRRRSFGHPVAARMEEVPGQPPIDRSQRSLARQRIRRFDYDRFYLRMLRDL